jgi:hypothetical protein
VVLVVVLESAALGSVLELVEQVWAWAEQVWDWVQQV